MWLFVFLYSHDNYRDKGQWVGNCSSAQILYETLANDTLNLIQSAGPQSYFSKKVNGNELQETQYLMIPIDRKFYGRCYTIRMTEPNIRAFRIIFNQFVKIYFHSYGQMKTKPPRVYTKAYPTEKKTITLEYDVFKFLSTRSEPCVEDIDYNEDECIDDLVHKQSMKNIGCTSPWTINKSQICSNQLKAIKATELYDWYFNHGSTKCPEPCTFTRVRASITHSTTNQSNIIQQNRIYINLDDKVGLYESFFVYSGLSLIAEIGGYVGLFLGVSLNQFYKVYEFIKFHFQKVL